MADKHLDMDSFGEIMDNFIHENEIALLVNKKENSDEWKIESNVDLGSVTDMFIILNAVEAAFINMLDEGDKIGVGWEADSLADSIGELLVGSMKKAAQKRKEARDG